MNKTFHEIFNDLNKIGYTVDKGLSDQEFNTIESTYEISFNIDHKEFLKSGLVTGGRFYNWRDDSDDNITYIREMLQWPLDGILFDIEFSNYWIDAIEKPASINERKEIFRQWYTLNVPKLIPIFSHRFMCSEPKLSGAPVYSVHQTDIIYYGMNITDYLSKEFHLSRNDDWPKWQKDETLFWSQIVS
jgi:hypothetical protein